MLDSINHVSHLLEAETTWSILGFFSIDFITTLKSRLDNANIALSRGQDILISAELYIYKT